MPSNQKQIIEQNKFTYSPLGKGFGKQTKATEGQDKPNQILILTEVMRQMKNKKKYLTGL